MTHLSVLFESAKTASEKQLAAERYSKHVSDGKIKLADISIRDIAESTLGRDGFDKMCKLNESSTFVGMQEAVDPVNLKAFTHITGNVLTRGVIDRYKHPEFIGDELVTNETDNLDEYTIPGMSEIEDDAMVVKEGDEYKTVKFGEDWQSIPQSEKVGLRIALTREMIFFDRTGRAMEMANSVGYRLGLNREKRILKVVLGIVNNYNRKGVAANTYLTTGPRINSLTSQDLLDYSQIEASEQAFEEYLDDRASGEPILVNPDTFLCSAYKMSTFQRLMGAREVRTQSTDAINSQTMMTYGPNPIGAGKKIITSPWIRRLLVTAGESESDAKKTWFHGAPKDAFRYTTLFPLQLRSMGRDSEDDFKRDVVFQVRADERGKAWVKNPWKMQKNAP